MKKNAALRLVLLRHGESVWNKENRFTGWTDVGLSEHGVREAHDAGKKLRDNGFTFDAIYTSVLDRAVMTTRIVQEEMGLAEIPVKMSWRLNERDYGALKGLDKDETRRQYGEKQVFIWRRGYDVRPPALTKSDLRYPGKDPKYAGLKQSEIPLTESLKDTVKRVEPYWRKEIVPALKKGKRALVSAHGNSIRGIVKMLDGIPDEEIPKLEIPTGKPLVYELDAKLRPLRHYYLE